MLKFRKIEIIWLKSQRFRCANSWKRHSEGRFSGKKSVESGVFLVKCVDFCTSSSGNQTNVLLERAEIDPVPPHRGIVVERHRERQEHILPLILCFSASRGERGRNPLLFRGRRAFPYARNEIQKWKSRRSTWKSRRSKKKGENRR